MTPLTSPTLVIEGGALSTNETLIDLQITSANATEMYITETADCESGGNWEPFNAAKTWTLGTLNQLATVYIKVRGVAGILSESPCASAAIIHDDIAPTGPSLEIVTIDDVIYSREVSLTLAATEALEMYITSDSLCASGGSWIDFDPSHEIIVENDFESTVSLYAKFRDAIGNESACVGDSAELMPNHVVKVSDGASCVLFRDIGKVKCFGENDSGKLGYGDNVHRGKSPNPVSSYDFLPFSETERVVDIDMGHSHSCVILEEGGVKCWGRNNEGQLGIGNLDTMGDNETVDTIPTLIFRDNENNPIRAEKLALGTDRSCVLLETKKVRCWGRYNWGMLGYGPSVTSDRIDATTVGDLDLGEDVIDLEVDRFHSCAILASHKLRCWGMDSYGNLGKPDYVWGTIGEDELPSSVAVVDLGDDTDQVKAIGLGDDHTCVALLSGKVRCWGNAQYGRLGYGNTTNITDPAASGYVPLPENIEIKSLVTSNATTCMIATNGQMFCLGWGENTGYDHNGIDDEVGDDETLDEIGPLNLVVGMLNADFSFAHTCGITSNDTVRCWGDNFYGGGGTDLGWISDASLAIDIDF